MFEMNSCKSDTKFPRIGGAVAASASLINISQCEFIRNEADQLGGAVETHGYLGNSGSLTIDTCRFEENSALNSGTGGAVHISSGSVIVSDSSFESNFANNYGGAVYCNTGANASFTTCVFTGNSASDNAGAIFFNGSSGVVTNCQCNGNYTTEEGSQGGAAYNSECTPSFINCDFTGNSSVFGSGMYNRVTSATLEGCVFTDNSATEETGVVHNYSGSNSTFESCVFINNSTTANIGGGIYNQTSTPTISNSILCGNTPNQIFGSYTDGSGNCFSDICDSDGDETLDCNDNCPNDPNKTEPGDCGCGTPETDTDEDGIADCNDPCPNWPYDCSEDGQTITVAVGQSIQDGLAATPVGGNLILAAGVHDLSGTLQISGNLLGW